MKRIHRYLGILTLLFVTISSANDLRTFTNADGKVLRDRILKYDTAKQIVLLQNNGHLPLKAFSKADREYILQWNQIDGFKSILRFKMSLERSIWARFKYEHDIMPYNMDVVQIPGKTDPVHDVEMYDACKEQNTVYLEAQGYKIALHNLNLFPLKNILMESKVFYEQEYYQLPDNIFLSGNSEYSDIISSNKVCFLSETIPAILSHEEVILHTDCALTIDHRLEREAESDLPDSTHGPVAQDQVDGMAGGSDKWKDHQRRRRGKIVGTWVRLAMKGPDGNIVWRNLTDPPYLADKISWDSGETNDSEE